MFGHIDSVRPPIPARRRDQPLELDGGTGPKDHSDLKALRAACVLPDLKQRQAELEKRLDIDQFLTFAAMEMMTSHWDGYCRNRNNYRIYFNPTNGKAIFFPHGMDQMFGDPNFPLFEVGGVVSSAVMQVPDFEVPASGIIDYQDRSKATGFTEGKWLKAVA